MGTTTWILAAVTAGVNLPSIFFYAIPGLRRAPLSDELRAALLFVLSRSAALAIAVIPAAMAAAVDRGSGWLIGLGIATALVQAIDVPIAAATGERRSRAATAIGASALLAVELVAIVLAVVLPS